MPNTAPRTDRTGGSHAAILLATGAAPGRTLRRRFTPCLVAWVRLAKLARACLSLALAALLSLSQARAADPTVDIVTQNGVVSTPGEAPGSGVPSLAYPLITLGVHAGYDSNSTTTGDGQGSFFTSEQLTLAYDRTRPGTQIRLITGAGLVERFGEKTDINAYINLSIARQVTPRLTLSGSIDSAYQAEPDFGQNVGPNQRVGNYFRSNDAISAAYQWTRRFSTVNSYSLGLVRYEDSFVASFTDREEHTLGEEFRFDLTRTTILVADYRFLAVNYDSFPRDSTTHFVLVGVEKTLSSRLQAQIRGGVSFRSFQEGESRTDPDFEGTVTYALNSLSSLNWTARYSVEEPVVRDALSRTTFRTGVQLRYGFTKKISAVVGIDYHHDETEEGLTAATSGPAFSTNAVQFVIGARYQISRHLDWDVSYEHSEVDSSSEISGYSRNRYSTGLSFTF